MGGTLNMRQMYVLLLIVLQARYVPLAKNCTKKKNNKHRSRSHSFTLCCRCFLLLLKLKIESINVLFLSSHWIIAVRCRNGKRVNRCVYVFVCKYTLVHVRMNWTKRSWFAVFSPYWIKKTRSNVVHSTSENLWTDDIQLESRSQSQATKEHGIRYQHWMSKAFLSIRNSGGGGDGIAIVSAFDQHVLLQSVYSILRSLDI